MITIKCPHCDKLIEIKVVPEFDEEKIINEVMEEIALDQGEVNCYV